MRILCALIELDGVHKEKRAVMLQFDDPKKFAKYILLC
jgi:hypothetical protein